MTGFVDSDHNHVEVKFSNTFNFENTPYFNSQIHRLWDVDNLFITFNLSNIDFISTAGLSTLASFYKYCLKFCKSNSYRFILPDNDAVRKYIERVKFFECLDPNEDVEYTSHDTCIELREVSNTERVEDVVYRVLEIFKNEGFITEEWAEMLFLPFAEILENTRLHSQSPVHAFVCAQYFPNIREFELSVVDCGIGFRESLEKNIKLQNIKDDLNSIECALQYGVTSNPKYHTGFGLPLARDLIVDNKGFIGIYSGRGYILNSQKYEVPQWKGSVIYLRFKLSNKMDVERICNKHAKLIDQLRNK